MVTLHEVIKTVLLMNREISIKHDTDNHNIIVSVTGYNKLQNTSLCHKYKIEGDSIPEAGELAQIIHLLDERIS